MTQRDSGKHVTAYFDNSCTQTSNYNFSLLSTLCNEGKITPSGLVQKKKSSLGNSKKYMYFCYSCAVV